MTQSKKSPPTLFGRFPRWHLPAVTLLLASLYCCAQPSPPPTTSQWTPDGSYWHSYLGDAAALATAPASWQRRHWLGAAATTATMVALFYADTTIQHYSQRYRSPTSDGITMVANYLGWGWTTLPALSLLYGYGWMSDSPRPRKAALLSLKAFVYSQLATETLKHLTHRHRPNAGDGHMRWDGPSFSANNLSFASGHATTAFAVATTCALVYHDNPLLNISLYTLASVTALSRISKNSHWASDVFVGSIIGYSTARFLVERYDPPSTPPLQITTLPTASGQPALGIRFTF